MANRPVVTVVLVVLALAYCRAEEGKQLDSLPAAAKQAMDRYDKSVAEAKKVYDAAVARAADAARKELLKVQEQETKAGRLESALAVKAQVDKLPEQTPAGSAIPKYFLDLADKIADGAFTSDEWGKLQGQKISVDARIEFQESRIVVQKGEVYLVAPNPADTWNGGGIDPVPCTYTGAPNGFMKLRVYLGDNPVNGYLITGEGKLVLSPYDKGHVDNSGSIRVKIIRIR